MRQLHYRSRSAHANTFLTRPPSSRHLKRRQENGLARNFREVKRPHFKNGREPPCDQNFSTAFQGAVSDDLFVMAL